MRVMPFFIDDIADSHAAGRFMIMNIDHQFCMQRFSSTLPASDAFDRYNTAHAKTVLMLRGHGARFCHVAYDPFSKEIASDLSADELEILRAHTHTLYRNPQDLTVSHALNRMTGHTERIHHDIISDIRDGDLVSFKSHISAYSNPLLHPVLQELNVTSQGYMGIFGPDCVLTSMRDSESLGYRTVAIGSAIEDYDPVQNDLQRFNGNCELFKRRMPGTVVTHHRELDEVLSEVLQPR